MRTAVIVLAAAALAGCGTAASTTGGSNVAASAPAQSAPGCHTQYESWKHGAAAAALAGFKSSISSVQAQGSAEDLTGMTRALARAGRAARRLAAVPVPKCADPAGDYSKMLALVKAAGDNARSASGLAGVVLAEAPLKKVPAAERKLNAELDATVGKSR